MTGAKTCAGRPEVAVQIVARGLRIAVDAADEALEASPALQGLTRSLIEEDEARGFWRLDAYPADPEEADEAWTLLAARPDLIVTRAKLADADWLAMALSGLPPVRAGRFFVFGMHDAGRVPAGAVALRIEAGAAFGTGHHGTTVGCLLALDRLLRRRRFERVLDVGTGTGVLAIAAARTGSALAVGTDIDPVSVRIARQNARVNRAPCRFAHAGGLRAGPVAAHAPYDLIFANILARPLVDLAGDIVGGLRPGGVVILSGLLRSQARYVLAAYRNRGLRLIGRIRRDAWATLVLRR